MSIVWLRHGETALNASRVMQPADTPLSPRGHAQAAAVAPRLAAMRPAALVSSDLPRAMQTAQAVAAATGLPLLIEPLLCERNFGDLRGRAHDSFGFDPLLMAEAPPGGESMADFLQRVALVWSRMAARRASLPGPLIVVSHGLLIHAGLERHAHWPGGPALPARMANTSVSIVDALPPHAVQAVDDTAHLAGIAPDDPRSLSGG